MNIPSPQTGKAPGILLCLQMLFSVSFLWGVEPEPGARLKFWVSSTQDEEFFRKAADDFLVSYPGLSVDLEAVSAVDARTKLETKGPAGLGPDLLVVPHDQLGDLRSSGHIMPNLVYTPGRRNEFLTWAMDALTFGRDTMGFPLSVETLVMFYNKNLFPSPPATWEELLDQGEKITRRGTYGLVFPVADLYAVHGFLTAYGASLFGPGGTDRDAIGLATPAAEKGLELLLKLRPLSLPQAGDATWEVVQKLFLEGRAGALLQGPWALPALKKAAFPLGAAPLPLIQGKRPRTFSGLMVLAVSSFSRFPRAAQIFADYLTSESLLEARFRALGTIPPLKSFFARDDLRMDPATGPFLVQLEASRPMPRLREMKYIWVPAAGALTEAWDGRAAPAEALRKAETTIRRQMELAAP